MPITLKKEKLQKWSQIVPKKISKKSIKKKRDEKEKLKKSNSDVVSTESILKTVDESKSIVSSIRSIKKPESDNYQQFLAKIESDSFSSSLKSEQVVKGIFSEIKNYDSDLKQMERD